MRRGNEFYTGINKIMQVIIIIHITFIYIGVVRKIMLVELISAKLLYIITCVISDNIMYIAICYI